LKSSSREFIALFNKNDAASIADQFTENGGLLPAYGDMVTGKGAIQAFWQAAFDMGIRTAERKTLEV
jgi:ketosteroid isomerase-like protein